MTSSPDIGQRPDRHTERAERAVRQRDVLGLEGDAGPALERLGDDGPRLGLVELVGEPVLVPGNGVTLERVDQPGEWQLLRIPEREVGDAGVRPMPLPRAAGEPREDVLDAGDHPVGASGRVGHGSMVGVGPSAGHRRMTTQSRSAGRYSSRTLPAVKILDAASRRSSGAWSAENIDLPAPRAFGMTSHR